MSVFLTSTALSPFQYTYLRYATYYIILCHTITSIYGIAIAYIMSRHFLTVRCLRQAGGSAEKHKKDLPILRQVLSDAS